MIDATRVVCLGDVMVDVLARLSAPLALGSDTPAPIRLLGGGSAPIRLLGGGSAANTAAWLVAEGVAATLIGRVGDDQLGRLAVDELRQLGVDLHVGVDSLRPTGTCIVLVGADGERTMVPSIGANDGLGEVEFAPALWQPGVWLHVSGYAIFADGSRSAAGRAVAAARAGGCPVSVDAASAAPLRRFGAAAFLEWLPPCLLVANRDEAEVLTGSSDPGEAVVDLGARCGEAIVKCGADGAVWSDGVTMARQPAVAAEVLDSTGAGDAFAAGVLAGRIAGLDVPGMLQRGADAAARAVSSIGARPGAPRRDPPMAPAVAP
jgi:sugar/nucleoside kinase (ribokinase family)